jgi:Tfp pilus assembly protein PilX
MKINKLKNNNRKKGFVMLFAVLISTLVLAVGISMISIALKQVVLSGSGRDSQYAFYVANTGAECATYWDLASSSVFRTNSNQATTDNGVKCLGMTITDTNLNATGEICNDQLNNYQQWCSWVDGSSTYKTKFRISYEHPGIDTDDKRPYCADVIVSKEIISGGPSDGLVGTTTVTSRGYNTCDEANSRRIERALEFSY